jgi:hypothetical protein
MTVTYYVVKRPCACVSVVVRALGARYEIRLFIRPDAQIIARLQLYSVPRRRSWCDLTIPYRRAP